MKQITVKPKKKSYKLLVFIQCHVKKSAVYRISTSPVQTIPSVKLSLTATASGGTKVFVLSGLVFYEIKLVLICFI